MAGMKKNGPGCCGCGPTYPGEPCSPCNVPGGPLTLDWFYWKVHYGGPYGTTYTAEPAATVTLAFLTPNPFSTARNWASDWFLGPTDSATCNPGPFGTGVLGSDCCYLRFRFACSPGGGPGTGLNMQIDLSSRPDGTVGKAYCSDGTVSARVGTGTFTCTPFSAVIGNTGYVGNLFAGGVLASP